MDQTVVIYLIKFVWIKKKYFALNGFLFFITLAIFLFFLGYSFFFFEFCFSHQQTRTHSVINDQLNVLIFASIFNFYFLFYDVYGFNVMPHGFASKPCSRKYEIAF